MTTTIKVTSNNYPALVRVIDRYTATDAGRPVRVETVAESVLGPEDGEVSFYCTTSRTVEVVDLEYADPRVPVLAPGAEPADAA